MQDILALLHSSLVYEIPALTETEKELLRQHTIDENHPGTILQDFQTLLNVLQPDGLEVSGVNNLLPLKILSELNSQLTHPIEIKLKRPVQKSYPYINGLYLLLRTSGITKIISKGKQQILLVDEKALASWSNLNATERYFNLLEAWLIWANSGILGEYHDPLGNLYRCVRFWSHLPDTGLKITKHKDQDMFGYYPALYNIALLDLFGFLSLTQGQSETGKGWRIATLQRTDFGDAMLKLLFPLVNKQQLTGELHNDVNISFGKLQPHLQSFFPEWQHNLCFSQQFVDGVYIFKVSLPGAWRRIAVPANLKLSLLAELILNAFAFDYDHLYEFSYKDRFGRTVKVNHPYIETPPFANEVKVGDLTLPPGGRMTYVYDFGDNWKFDVHLERIESLNKKVNKPQLLESYGKAPQQYWSE